MSNKLISGVSAPSVQLRVRQAETMSSGAQLSIIYNNTPNAITKFTAVMINGEIC